MDSKDEIDKEEESIRKLVRELPDEKRSRFFSISEKKLKDPDTYATLNYIFIAGLHHFYLGKLGRGISNILIFWIGVALLFSEHLSLGVGILIAITVFELYELFRSQTIVQDYNNKIMKSVYEDINKA